MLHGKKMMENQHVNDFIANIGAHSELTARVYIKNLRIRLEYIYENLDFVIESAENNLERFSRKVLQQIMRIENEGEASSYICTTLFPLIAYIKLYDVPVRLIVNIRDSKVNLIVMDEKVLEK